MKTFSIVLSSCLVSTALASVPLPKLSVTVQDGKFSDIYGLNPTASWSNTNEVGELDIGYGIEADVRVTKDIASLPKKIWGKISSQVGAWGVSAKADFKGIDYSKADVTIGAANDEEGLSITAKGSCSSDGIVLNKIEAKKSMEQDGANISVNPSYDVQSEEATVVVSYEKDGTSVEVEASNNAQTVTLSRQLDDENRVTPMINSSGDVSIAWEHKINDSTVTTTFEPQKSINVNWEEGGWKAQVSMDLENTDITNVNVSVKKDLVF